VLELIAELHRRDFTVGIVTGGGTEFVRAISDDLYGCRKVSTPSPRRTAVDDAGSSPARTTRYPLEAAGNFSIWPSPEQVA
jgi:hypothetical protein